MHFDRQENGTHVLPGFEKPESAPVTSLFLQAKVHCLKGYELASITPSSTQRDLLS